MARSGEPDAGQPGDAPAASRTAVGSDDGWAEILSRVRDRDRAAFDELVQELWMPTYQFFWKRVDREDAEDLTQEVFVSLYRAIGRGGGPEQDDLESWRRYVGASARNRWIDQQRRRSARGATWKLETLLGDDVAWPQGGPAADESDAAERLLARELADAVERCLGELDSLRRSICWLHFVDGRSKREVARTLGRSESSVRALMVKALAALRRCLQRRGLGPSRAEV